ncbi:MAG TPA: aldo/keto reductase, partial [Gemmatimonadaceae bacterium]
EWMADDKMAALESLTAFAESRGHTILELAFSWLLSRSVVASVIAGATSPAQIKSNSSAAAWQLTDYELTEIDRVVGEEGYESRRQKADGRKQTAESSELPRG